MGGVALTGGMVAAEAALLTLLLSLACVDQPAPPPTGTAGTQTTATPDTGTPPTDTHDSTPSTGETGDTAPRDTAPADADGDGFTTLDDCDDADANSYPGARELCDGRDNDCDGADDTLGHWPFDDGTGETAADAGPLGLDGVVTSGTWTDVGVLGGALSFDGAGTYVTLDHSELASMVGITLSAWVRPDSLQAGSWDSVITRGASATSDMACCRDSYFLGYYLEGLSFYTDTTLDNTPLLDGAAHGDHVGGWHHLVATWDPATGERAVYADGVQTAADLEGPPTAAYDGTPTRIGADTNNGSYTLPFHGDIDEVKIFGCAITADEAALDHATGWPF